MTENTLPSIGLAYRWLLAYYKDVAQFCRRVRDEFTARQYASYTPTDSIEVRSSKSLSLTQNWLPCYHYQFFLSRFPDTSGAEMERAALLCVGIDHFDPTMPERSEPVVYLARFGPLSPDDLGRLKNDIVYNWTVEEPVAPAWRAGTFREVAYTYHTLPLSEISTLDDVVPKIVDPLLNHDRTCVPGQGIVTAPYSAP